MRGILFRAAPRVVPLVRAARCGFGQPPLRTLCRTRTLSSEPHVARPQAPEASSDSSHPRLSLSSNYTSCKDFIAKYGRLKSSEQASEKEIQLCGRIRRSRFAGSKLVFLDIEQDHHTVQILCSYKDVGENVEKADFKSAFHKVQRGDVIQVVGQPQRTPSGELSLRLYHLPQLLSPCQHPMPDILQDNATRMKKRHVDLRINRRLSSTMYVRSAILQYFRSFLIADGHVEVQTPILADGAGGAIARSFTTHATEFPERNMNLRIAPELWLKRLVVGGMDRVFEIGPSFRNEGLDLTHNPEFTTCEFYRTYTDLEKLLSMTESLFQGLARHIKTVQTELGLDLELPTTNFQGPYKRLDFVPDIELRAQCKLPDLTHTDAILSVRQILSDRSISFNEGNTLPQLLDRLAAHYLEPECVEPTWIINHPECMSPLSKSFPHPQTGHAVSARGELFVHGKELVNTYEEENSPIEQRRKFEQQLLFRDEENESYVDESYLEVLEWGMPPTGGLGCGIDRLCMLMTGATRISDVLPFGNLRNVVNLRQP